MSSERAIEMQERAWALQADGRLDEAADACREAIHQMELHEGVVSPDIANLLNDLAEIELHRENLVAAISLAGRARDVEDHLGDDFAGKDAARIRIRTFSLLGELQRLLGDPDGAERALLDAVAAAENEFGEGSVETGEARNDLAVAYKYAGRFAEALSLYRSALVVIESRDGAASLNAGAVHHNIGGVFHAMGDFAGAEEPGRRAWEISRRLLGESHPQTLLDAAAYAAILDGLERYEESEPILRHALEVLERKYGPEHREVGAVLHNLAAVVASRGHLEEAERNYRRALSIKDRLFGDDSADAALTRNNLGRLLNEAGRKMEAEALLVQALTCLSRQLDAGHPHLLAVENNLRCARAGEPLRQRMG